MKLPFNKFKIILLISAVLLLIITVITTQRLVSANAEERLPPPAPTVSAPEVSITWQQASDFPSTIQGYGAAEPHYQMNLTAQVSGQIEKISPRFDSGYHFSKNDWFAKLENSQYVADIASAQQALAQANVDLLEEQRQGQQALLEWESANLPGKPDSELVLRKPQLLAAKAAIKQAQAALNQAQKNLSYTTITAPFDAVVVERLVAPGSFVMQGTEIATLNSDDRVEIKIALSAKQWQNLPAMPVLTQTKWSAIIDNVETDAQWQGYIIRTEKHLDSETRQQILVIAVDKPFDAQPALIPGTFVKATITGEAIKNLWRLPASALSQRGEVWYVSNDNLLNNFSTTPRFSRDGYIFVDVPEQFTDQKVAVLTHPLNSYLVGMTVTPVEANHE